MIRLATLVELKLIDTSCSSCCLTELRQASLYRAVRANSILINSIRPHTCIHPTETILSYIM